MSFQRIGRLDGGRIVVAVVIAIVLLMQLPWSALASSTSSPAAGEVAGGGCPGYFYRVQRGDTLYSIARRTHTTVYGLMRANGIPNPNRIYAGQWLCIPQRRPPGPPPGPINKCMPGTANCHMVQKGETLFSIARLYNTTPQCLMTLNNFRNPNVIFAGQWIRIGFCSD